MTDATKIVLATVGASAALSALIILSYVLG